MNWLQLTCWTYFVFVLHSAAAPSLAVAGATPHLVLAGLSLVASRVTARQALVMGALWGLAADGLTDGRLGAGVICLALASWLLQRSAGLSNRGSTWKLPILSVAVIFACIVGMDVLRTLFESRPVDLRGLCVHAAGSAIYTSVIIAISGLALRMLRGKTTDGGNAAVPHVANRWRMLTD